jgi:hypothetical protein
MTKIGTELSNKLKPFYNMVSKSNSIRAKDKLLSKKKVMELIKGHGDKFQGRTLSLFVDGVAKNYSSIRDLTVSGFFIKKLIWKCSTEKNGTKCSGYRQILKN